MAKFRSELLSRMEWWTSPSKEKQQYILLIQTNEQRKFNGRLNSGLTRFSGKTDLITNCVEDRVRQSLSGRSCHWTTGSERSHFSGKSLLQLQPFLLPDLINILWLKDYLCSTNPLYHLAKISKFNMLFITYQEPHVAKEPPIIK